MMILNINEVVKFKLTNEGERILQEYLDNQTRKYDCNAALCYPLSDKLGYRCCTLWEFMMVFGKYFDKPCGVKIIKDDELIIGG